MDATVGRASGIRYPFIIGQFAPNGEEISGMGNAD
jgi:hypothetical protein